MDANDRTEMARLMREVLNGLYAMRPQLVTPADGSRGNDDRVNDEKRRNGDPWGSIPAETYTTIVAGLSVATVDHLHGCAQIMLDDVDFGPGVMARCTLEAAGRLTWLLDPNLDVRERSVGATRSASAGCATTLGTSQRSPRVTLSRSPSYLPPETMR